MAPAGRVKSSVYNFTSSLILQFITIVFQFIVKTVFIKTLGKEYLGINGLFANIFMMLSLAELGVGNAILFKLYKPVLEKDEVRVRSLLYFYRKIYFYIGLLISVIGIAIIPFLSFFIKDYASLSNLGINAATIFVLYLLQSVSSYLFFAYKTSIIKADQKQYVLNFIASLFQILMSLLQIAELLIYKNFIGYVVIYVVSTILQNLAGAWCAQKMYPYINEKDVIPLRRAEVTAFFKDCYALMIYKMNAIVLKATDSIVISKFIGLVAVGIYSNYNYITQAIKGLLVRVYESFVHSIGNLHAADEPEKEYLIFKAMNLLAVILGGISFVGIACLADEFIVAWIGSEWKAQSGFEFFLGFEILTLSYREMLGQYRNTYGLFQQGKYRPLFGIILNLLISILLVQKVGIKGVLIGTVAADWLTMMWYDPLVVYKYGFKNRFKLKEYYIKNLLYVAGLLISYLASKQVCGMITLSNKWLMFVIHGIVCVIITSLTIALMSFKTKEVNYILNVVKRRFLKRGTK